MTEQYDARILQDTTDQAARTRAFVGLGLALVGLMGGGMLGSAVFYLVLGSTDDSGAFSMVAQGLPGLLLGLPGPGSGGRRRRPRTRGGARGPGRPRPRCAGCSRGVAVIVTGQV